MATENPILSLPNELIVEIAVVSQTRDEGNIKSELVLSSICRHLRYAVIGAPELWTKVELDPSSENSINLSQIYLERSAAREIWITLRSRGVKLQTRGLHQLTPHLPRISRLNVVATVILKF
ncbi:hypothetical protein FB45DRAFT_918257 [Roridomyces roridus]|uniref:F-box domain-containing protein n=1 Tax=Roridomyces roridus TaxID=1738132 RepID=A0AAD7FJM9_9AGAR|nr:hypothetical protein FB45DRAFT_918189 [Roridomyces roridus]KAJ7628422.1 hypothetical protein FB45DRAFT_918257 [Roridomyces roridus]